MKKEQHTFSFEVYDTIDEMNEQDAALLKAARKVTEQAYAPYSQFHVGAAAKMDNGEMVSGTNQENASFPAGICAERALLSTAASLYPNMPIDTMAVSYHNMKGDSNRPISPCGICRQVLREYESRVKHPIRIILGGQDGKVYIIDKAEMLLPLSFSAEDMA